MSSQYRVFDAASYLRNEEECRLYLEDVARDGDNQELVEAIKTVARARGVLALAKDAGMDAADIYAVTTAPPGVDIGAVRQLLSALGITPAEAGSSHAAE